MNMKKSSGIVNKGIVAAVVALSMAAGGLAQESIEQLEKQVQQNRVSLESKAALAEAYLRDCQLEKSLGLWRQILSEQPDNARAKLVVERLTAQALDLDTQLETIGTLIDKGVFKGTDSLLDAAAKRAATDSQKARILYLRGRMMLRDFEQPAPITTVPRVAKPARHQPAADDDDQSATQPAGRSGPFRPGLAVILAPKVEQKEVPAHIPTEPPLDTSNEASARAYFQGAMALAPDSPWAARAVMLLARLDVQAGQPASAMRLLRQVT